MRKAAHPLGSMDSSNPRRWRGERLHHHGDVVCRVVCAFCAVSSGRCHSLYVDKYKRITIRCGYGCACTIPNATTAFVTATIATVGSTTALTCRLGGASRERWHWTPWSKSVVAGEGG